MSLPGRAPSVPPPPPPLLPPPLSRSASDSAAESSSRERRKRRRDRAREREGDVGTSSKRPKHGQDPHLADSVTNMISSLHVAAPSAARADLPAEPATVAGVAAAACAALLPVPPPADLPADPRQLLWDSFHNGARAARVSMAVRNLRVALPAAEAAEAAQDAAVRSASAQLPKQLPAIRATAQWAIQSIRSASLAAAGADDLLADLPDSSLFELNAGDPSGTTAAAAAAAAAPAPPAAPPMGPAAPAALAAHHPRAGLVHLGLARARGLAPASTTTTTTTTPTAPGDPVAAPTTAATSPAPAQVDDPADADLADTDLPTALVTALQLLCLTIAHPSAVPEAVHPDTHSHRAETAGVTARAAAAEYAALLEGVIDAVDGAAPWLLTAVPLSWETWLGLVGLLDHPVALIQWGVEPHGLVGVDFFALLALCGSNAPALRRLVGLRTVTRDGRSHGDALVQGVLSSGPVFDQVLATMEAWPAAWSVAEPEPVPDSGSAAGAATAEPPLPLRPSPRLPPVPAAVGDTLAAVVGHGWARVQPGQHERLDAALSGNWRVGLHLLDTLEEPKLNRILGPHSWARIVAELAALGTQEALGKAQRFVKTRHVTPHVSRRDTFGEAMAISAVLGPDAPRHLHATIWLVRKLVPGNKEFMDGVLPACSIDALVGFRAKLLLYIESQQQQAGQVCPLVAFLANMQPTEGPAAAPCDVLAVLVALASSARRVADGTLGHYAEPERLVASDFHAHLASALSDPTAARFIAAAVRAAPADYLPVLAKQIVAAGMAGPLLSAVLEAHFSGLDLAPLDPEVYKGGCLQHHSLLQQPAWRDLLEIKAHMRIERESESNRGPQQHKDRA
ncbi:hypothetical protein H9P43_002793 [Blastocladiella emersonii ATCC 22665]|nr:hypothetical protein H9P43_002793 [Blastocladiella emersonii ATCC 22665]